MRVALALAQESDEGDFGEVILWLLLIIALVGLAAFMVGILPILMALRHGWRWALAVTAAAWLCAVPIQRMYDSGLDGGGDGWGLISFPLWIVLAVVARRGPPEWLPALHRPDHVRL